ncbi:MAG: nicotinate-nucleotide adenylyltransferase [Clostridia bacterium]|nr:nicotinate-nucleotide adenylyltransferase [Clostridia bacterium]
MKIGLLFGSFNPVHIGHMIVAGYMHQFTDLDKVWFVVSPENPLKDKRQLLADHHRLMLLKTAIDDNPTLGVTDIEFKMPRPSFTIDTLTWLSERYPEYEFVLIAGTDILGSLTRWKNYRVLLEFYKIYIYNRPGFAKGEFASHPAIRYFDAPLLDISSSFIRQAIAAGKDVRYMLPPHVWDYICEMHFYEK